jgi:NAD(P)-dependent dehydrogenase (short-subunit alcohol dehydrogenase family)
VVNDRGGDRTGAGPDPSVTGAGPARQVADEITAAGGAAVANTDDISTWDGARALVAQAVDVFGGLDVVVNNAGILRDRMLVNMSEEEWDSVVRVHLKGTFAVARHAAAYWRDRHKAGRTNDARIINTTSVSGLYGNIGQANYGAAKAGIAGFTVIAARELGRYGVTVNAIAPGALTRMTEDLPIAEPVKAALDPRWVAPVCVWLASPLSADVTEQILEVSGTTFAIAEGWHRGPTGAPVADPADVDAAVRKMLADARPHTSMAEVTSKRKDV